MGEIRLPGLSTGIDTSELVKQLMYSYSYRLRRYEAQQTKLDETSTALGEVRSKVSALESAVSEIADMDDLESFLAVSSDEDSMTVSTNSDANAGSHSVEINQLATNETWIQETSTFSYETDYVGGGTFILSYNHKEFSIQTIENDTTVQDLVGLINNDPDNPGVTAGLLYQDGTYHLMLTGNETGADNVISINSSNTELLAAQTDFTESGDAVAASRKLVDLDQFSGSLGTTDTITISGTDNTGTAITPFDMAVTENTTIQHLIDGINDAFNGVGSAWYEDGKIYMSDDLSGASSLSLSLSFSADPAGSASLTLPSFAVETEGGTITGGIASLDPATFINTQSGQDAQVKVNGYPPGVDEWISRSSNNISDIITGVTLNLLDVPDAGSVIQVTINHDTEEMQTKIEDFVTAYNELMDIVEEKTQYNEDTKRMGILSRESAVSFIKTSLRNPLVGILQGFDADLDEFNSASDIGLSLDSSGRIELDTSKLDDAINDNFKDLIRLIGAVGEGFSDSSSISFYDANEYTEAGQYNVRVQYDATGAIVAAWIKGSDEDWSAAREANVDGNMIWGTLDYSSDYPEKGLRVSFQWPNDGANTIEATVNVKHGFGGQLAEVLDEILETGTGRLDVTDDSIDERIDSIETQIEREEDRLSKIEMRLIEKYARMETIISMLQQQLNALG